ncbi:hypothetical protein DKG74_07070 [Zavarzinia aquatilis]|uniref:Uncharacterized protein n=2 Tax=Zavarzinia aquatilis TaxID=2211142 RepID=A0A317ECC6_9PROT|nr:hypothetical protein DKG74_07070 [Zavarzinia aquatilis]
MAVFGRREVEDCPIAPLGHRNGIYFFVSRAGEVRSGSAKDFGYAGLISLFDGDTEWLATMFPPGSRATAPFDHAMALAWLIRSCVEAGIWDESTPMRSVGTWRVKGGALAVHCGDAIWYNGEWLPGGATIEGIRYPTAARVSRPDFDAIPDAATVRDRLLSVVKRWTYLDPLGAEMVMGWLAAAFLGGAPSWRNHVIVQAGYGAGKSTLTALMSAALGDAADRTQTDTSEAGTRKAKRGEARAIILDETEDDAGSGHHVRKMIGLLRRMSSRDGASTRRADGGRAVEDRVVGAAWMAAILPPVLEPQDRSRFIAIALGPLDGRSDPGDIDAAIEDVGALSTGLWARMITGWGRFCDSFAAYRADLIALGCTVRMADLVGTWVAARDTMLEDEVLGASAREAEIDRLRPYLAALMDSDQGEGHGEECWRHLLSSPMDTWHGGSRRVVGGLLYEALYLVDAEMDAKRALKQVGIRILTETPPGEANGVRVIAVANQHAGLAKLFAGTIKWQSGGWATALKLLPGAWAPAKPTRFAGALSRWTAIPADYIQPDAAEEQRDGGGEGIPDVDAEA